MGHSSDDGGDWNAATAAIMPLHNDHRMRYAHPSPSRAGSAPIAAVFTSKSATSRGGISTLLPLLLMALLVMDSRAQKQLPSVPSILLQIRGGARDRATVFKGIESSIAKCQDKTSCGDEVNASRPLICPVLVDLVNIIAVKEVKATSTTKENFILQANITTSTAAAKNGWPLLIVGNVILELGLMLLFFILLGIMWRSAKERYLAFRPEQQQLNLGNDKSLQGHPWIYPWNGWRRASDRRRRTHRVVALRQSRARLKSFLVILILSGASVSDFMQNTDGLRMEDSGDTPSRAAASKIQGNRTGYETSTGALLRLMGAMKRENTRMHERLSEANTKLKERKVWIKTETASGGKNGNDNEGWLVENQHLTRLLERKAKESSIMRLKLQNCKEMTRGSVDDDDDDDVNSNLNKNKGFLRHYHQHQLLRSEKAAAAIEKIEEQLPFVNITQDLIDTHLSEADHAMLNTTPTPRQRRRRLAACPTFTADGNWVILTQDCAMSGEVSISSGQTLKVKSNGGTRWKITAASSKRHFHVKSGGDLIIEGVELTGGNVRDCYERLTPDDILYFAYIH